MRTISYALAVWLLAAAITAAAEAPETINSDAYEEGWMFKLKLLDAGELDALMDAEAYAEHCENEDH